MTKIPPKGQTVVDLEVTPVPHGVAVTIQLRSLLYAATMKGDHKAALLFAWRVLAVELQERGVNLYAAMADMPERMDREDLSGG